MAHLEEVLKKPVITEKATTFTDKTNRYGFVVDLGANKHQIKLAVEKLDNVKVMDVKTNITPGKMKRYGKVIKKSPKVKKAYVKLSEGQKIEFFKGV